MAANTLKRATPPHAAADALAGQLTKRAKSNAMASHTKPPSQPFTMHAIPMARTTPKRTRVNAAMAHATPAANHVYVTRSTPLAVYVERIRNLLHGTLPPHGPAGAGGPASRTGYVVGEGGRRQVHVFAAGAAIPAALMVVLRVQAVTHSLVAMHAPHAMLAKVHVRVDAITTDTVDVADVVAGVRGGVDCLVEEGTSLMLPVLCDPDDASAAGDAMGGEGEGKAGGIRHKSGIHIVLSSG
jgi:hypothetical protein